MATITKDYVAIPKTTYIKFQREINSFNLSEDDKVEFWFISESDLSESQNKKLEEVKKMKDSEFINI